MWFGSSLDSFADRNPATRERFMNINLDYYQLLGIRADASEEEIKKAWRKKRRECHPDKFLDEARKQEMTRVFQELHEAYDVLSHKSQRMEYDRKRRMQATPHFQSSAPNKDALARQAAAKLHSEISLLFRAGLSSKQLTEIAHEKANPLQRKVFEAFIEAKLGRSTRAVQLFKEAYTLDRKFCASFRLYISPDSPLHRYAHLLDKASSSESRQPSNSGRSEQKPQTPPQVQDYSSPVEFVEKALMGLLLSIAALIILAVLAAVGWVCWFAFSQFGFIDGLVVLVILFFGGLLFLFNAAQK